MTSALDPSLVDAVTSQLVSRATSIFGRVGNDARQHVAALLDALDRDLEAGKRDAVRPVVQSIVAELSAHGLTFADLRYFAQTVRKVLVAAVEADPALASLRKPVDDWLYELLLVLTMSFMARSAEVQQKQTAKQELHQLESQLGEMQAALAEKTRLLEVIRQASTPIAPVVQGILVVPLVGLFDAFRAEVLTERLLTEVALVHARAVILDISGVPVFDSEPAQLIVRLARSLRLLGTEVFVVGMSPANAQTIVALQIDLSGLRTLATLQDGLAQALVLQRLRIAPL